MMAVDVIRGDGPVVLGLPHGGTEVPPEVWDRLNDRGRGLSDTDHHIDRLYDGLLPSATVVRCPVHRYVIDCNRDPGGASLYPGRNTTGLIPETDFDGLPIWREGAGPGPEDAARWREAVHAPYHAALAAALARARARHGIAVLWDCHSIRSEIPFLFDGVLPVFNVGTADGAACAEALAEAVVAACPPADTVRDGRFKGGWTTRAHGRPERGVHAVQMELAQRAYMTEAPPWDFDAETAEAARPVLARALAAVDRLARSGALTGG